MAWRQHTAPNGWTLTAANGGLSYNSPYTKMCWARVLAATAAAGGLYKLCIQDSAGDAYGMDLAGFTNYDEPSNLHFTVYASLNSTTNAVQYPSGARWRYGQWYHLTMRRRSATALDIFVDGRLLATETLNVGTSRNTSSRNDFAMWAWDGGWTNRMDECCAYKGWQRALTDAEVAQEMRSYRPRSVDSLKYALPFVNSERGLIVGQSATGLSKYDTSALGYFTNEHPPLLRPRRRSLHPGPGRIIKSFTIDTAGDAPGRIEIAPAEWASVSAWPWTPRVRVVSQVRPPISLSAQTVSVAAGDFTDLIVTVNDAAGLPVPSAVVTASSGATGTALADPVTLYPAGPATGWTPLNMATPVLEGLTPEGNQAYRVNETATASVYHTLAIDGEPTSVSGRTYRYVQEWHVGSSSGIEDSIVQTMRSGGFGSALDIYWNGASGTVRYNTGGLTVGSYALGNGWFRTRMQRTATAAATLNFDLATDGQYTGSTANYILVARAWVEELYAMTDANGQAQIRIYGVAAGSTTITVTADGKSVDANVTVT